MTISIDVLPGLECGIGEGPLWDVGTQALYLVDVLAPAVARYRPSTGEVTRWPVTSPVGCVAIVDDRTALVGLASGLHTLDLETGALTFVVDPEPDEPRTGLSEGSADSAGRFLFSTLEVTLTETLGHLYALEADGSLTTLLSGIHIPNAICWSPQGDQLYFTDSGKSEVRRFSYDVATGAIADQGAFLDLSDRQGKPDGGAIDAEGYYWVAMVMGGAIARYTPQGELDREIQMPVPMISSVEFGGANLDELYVTSIDPSIHGAPGEGGSTYRITGLGVQGSAEHRAVVPTARP